MPKEGTPSPDFQSVYRPLVDANCARVIETTSSLITHRQQTFVRLAQFCVDCGGCATTYAGEIGDADHLAEARREFCAPGQRKV